MPLFSCLFKIIKQLLYLTYFPLLSLNNKTFSNLCRSLLQGRLYESCPGIYFVNDHLLYNSQDNNPNSRNLIKNGIHIKVVNSVPLSVPLCYWSDLIFLNGTIWFHFPLENPIASNWFATKRQIRQNLGVVLHDRWNLTVDSFLP